jgi:hypothetical protein
MPTATLREKIQQAINIWRFRMSEEEIKVLLGLLAGAAVGFLIILVWLNH